jgi:hypothetical protein
MTAIVWIHADCLRRECAAFLQYPTAPAIFVWDDVVLRGYGLSLKRMVFLYECLLDLNVAIYRGDVAAQPPIRRDRLDLQAQIALYLLNARLLTHVFRLARSNQESPT